MCKSCENKCFKVYAEYCVCLFRKASLALIRKMVHYSSEVLLKEVCDSETGHNLPTVLVEITATVLDQEVHTEKISWFQLGEQNYSVCLEVIVSAVK